MSFPTYPAYRESGVEWIGLLPSRWTVRRVSTVAELINGFPFDSDQFDPEVGLPLIRIRDLNATEAAVRFAGTPVEGALITSADLLIGMDGDFNVGRWMGEGAALLNQRMCCLRGRTEMIRWLEYVLPMPLRRINDVTYSTTVKHLSSGQVRNIRVPMPECQPDLRNILSFLDRECGKIDALVAEQERLIALLKEKRQAVISEAVTKGLDPNAPMKDSGIEWLGQVPAHWEVSRVKRAAHIVYGLGQPPDYEPEGTPFVRATNVKQGTLSAEGLTFVDADLLPPSRVTRLRTGDIIVVRSGAYTGDSAIVTSEWRGAVAGFDMVVRLSEGVEPEFVAAALLSRYVLEGQLNLLRHRAAQPHLNAEELGGVILLLPPSDEQRLIARFLRAELSGLATLTTEAERAIALLKERRAALISAAVTGKIDVRGLCASMDDAA